MKQQNNWNLIIQYLKTYGFFFVNSDIYNGLTNSYDYGPLGYQLKEELINNWKKFFIQKHDNIFAIDGNILLKADVLKASGHLQNFCDYIVQCSNCNFHNKYDNLWPETPLNQSVLKTAQLKADQLPKRKCQKCQLLIPAQLKSFNLLFKTGIGVEVAKKQPVYLRPETAQNIFINFPHLIRTLQPKLPFGIAQIGKVFRNEMTTQNFVFRTLEFTQLELEFFYINSQERDNWFKYWQNQIHNFLIKILKIKVNNLRVRPHHPDELAHYSKKTIDFEYQFPFGWKEIWGLADRGQFDLLNHQKTSGVKMHVLDHNNIPQIPYVIEPSTGLERLLLTLIVDKLMIETSDTKPKFLLQLPFKFCYYQIAILPLTEKITSPSFKIYQSLKNHYRVKFDSKKSIGKRYIYHDAIGTYYCITYDFNSIDDQKVTIRYRDTKQQVRVPINELGTFFENENWQH